MGLATSNLQLYKTTQKSPLSKLHFGGWQFAFWRLKFFWGCFIEKGGPQKGWYVGFSPRVHSGRDAEACLPYMQSMDSPVVCVH